jgi:signal transduction histidine kinase
MPDGFGERHRAALERYLRTHERTLDWDYVELPGVHADGTEVPLAVSFSEFRYRGDRFFTGVVRDISDRKAHERQLEARAQQQQAVADLGQFALEVEDVDEIMREAARRVSEVLDTAYCKVLDLDAEERELLLRQGVGWDEGVVGTATVDADENSQAGFTLLSEEPVVVDDLATETRFQGPDLLTSHGVRSGVSTIVGSVDEPWGILGTHDTERREFTEEDVTFVQAVANILAEAIERSGYRMELKQLVGDLEASNQRLEQFAYAASHDLQEPLRMVSSYLRLLERRHGDDLDGEAEEFLEFAVEGADRMREMIDSLLEYSRVDTRGDPFEPVDLDAVLADARQALTVKFDERDAEMTAAELPRVHGDRSQLVQLFQNLLDNAIEYSDDTPRVRVDAERRGAEWVVSVDDEGVGIDPDDQERVFEVFQSVHGQDAGGTGIGLALVERIVERHGGDVWVDSEPGEGSTFSFSLPAVGEGN